MSGCPQQMYRLSIYASKVGGQSLSQRRRTDKRVEHVSSFCCNACCLDGRAEKLQVWQRNLGLVDYEDTVTRFQAVNTELALTSSASAALLFLKASVIIVPEVKRRNACCRKTLHSQAKQWRQCHPKTAVSACSDSQTPS